MSPVYTQGRYRSGKGELNRRLPIICLLACCEWTSMYKYSNTTHVGSGGLPTNGEVYEQRDLSGAQ